MSIMSEKRHAIVRELIPRGASNLLDIGCGPIGAGYAYRDRAEHIVCVDHDVRVHGPVDPHITVVDGDFLALDVPGGPFDAIVCADVFEHIPLELERRFAEKCIRNLAPGGTLVVSTPHAGRFAWLDPYRLRPAMHGALHRLGLYRRTHNGTCDVRKGHKHYTREELVVAFSPLVVEDERLWGHFYDPLASWTEALAGKLGGFPFRETIAERVHAEYRRDWGEASFNIALCFRKI